MREDEVSFTLSGATSEEETLALPGAGVGSEQKRAGAGRGDHCQGGARSGSGDVKRCVCCAVQSFACRTRICLSNTTNVNFSTNPIDVKAKSRNA